MSYQLSDIEKNKHSDYSCLWLISVIILIYWPVLDQWYFADDFHWLMIGQQSLIDPALTVTHRFFNYYRPCVTLSFAIENILYSQSALGHHFFNLILHIGSTYLVYRITKQLIGHSLSALFGASIFACAFAGSEAVIWVSGRADLLSTFFFLWSIYLVYGNGKTSAYRKIILFFAVTVALFSKESTAIWPIALCILDWAQNTSPHKPITQFLISWIQSRWMYIVFTGMIGLFHFIFQWHNGPFISQFGQPLIAWNWLRNIFGGSAITFISPLERVLKVDTHGIITSLVLILCSLLLIKRGNKYAITGYLLSLCLMIPASLVPFPFLPEPHLTFRRFFYLPALGASIFWAAVARDTFFRSRFMSIAGILLLSGTLLYISFDQYTLLREPVLYSDKTDQIPSFLSDISPIKQIKLWSSLTSQHRIAMESVQQKLNDISPGKEILIVVPQPNIWIEMFQLFSGRPVTVTRELPSTIPNDDPKEIFTFVNGIIQRYSLN